MRGIALEERGESARAEENYRRAIRWDRRWSVPWYNLGLLYKGQGNWPESLRHNRRAVELDSSDEAAWWNLGIAATALGEWREARAAWRACGIEIPEGDGPPDLDFGLVPIRLDPAGCGEVVWCRRIDPARAVIRNVPLPEVTEPRDRRIGIAASSEAVVRSLVEPFVASASGATIDAIECALPPLPVQ